jgi:hypothetical protein
VDCRAVRKAERFALCHVLGYFLCIGVSLLHVRDQNMDNVGSLARFGYFHYPVAVGLSLLPRLAALAKADNYVKTRILHVGRLSAPLDAVAYYCNRLVLDWVQRNLVIEPSFGGHDVSLDAEMYYIIVFVMRNK